MGKAEREKGKRGERELASVLRDAGYSESKRSVQYCGMGGESADVLGLPGVHIECKRTERLELWKSIDQAISDCKQGNIPVVMHRPSRRPWIVIIRLDDFIPMYREWHSGKVLEEDAR